MFPAILYEPPAENDNDGLIVLKSYQRIISENPDFSIINKNWLSLGVVKRRDLLLISII
jgi:hypothetical protein